ncbi:MAG TPA: PKD domain-containing protein [Gemmataceae bacterium]|nr:PKD domain-containing protein [Gemmataceae bacterium]
MLPLQPRAAITTSTVLVTLLAFGAASPPAPAQDSWPGGTLCWRRVVQLPAGASAPAVVVAEFFTHGDLSADGRNLAVFEGERTVPWRVLQVGPGDFCRVAFQTVRGGKAYRIYYGGPTPVDRPAWGESPGLLLETRRWKACDPQRAAAVRNAFTEAEPVGADYVASVSHRFNPFLPNPEPFLSRYRGTLHVESTGKYLFFTSSQDCSFLLIDGQEVVAAPGLHGPVHDARIKGEVHLDKGPHTFEYLHAASGPEACMVAAWQPPKAAQPEPIPARAFGADEVAHLPAVGLRHVVKESQPDFSAVVTGEAPVLEAEQPLVRVQFRDLSAAPVTARTATRWDFGDGQTSEQAEPAHVYLRPGLYAVKLSVTRTGQTRQTVNRILVHRGVTASDPKKGPDQVADYLPLLNQYDATRLSKADVLQLVRACDQAGQGARAAKAGKAALLAATAEDDQETLLELVRVVAPLLRDRCDDAEGALAVWPAVGRAISAERGKTECELEAADVCLNDLLRRGEAEPLLKSAKARLARSDNPALTGRLQRLWGDWHARGGDREKARAAYERAAACLTTRRSAAEQNAWRGSFSRSAEAFLRDNELDRARDELRRWQEEFPGDKVDGYLPLLQAQYWAARGKYAQAVAVAGDLAALNPDSPYADRLALLAAECEEKQGHVERALAAYKAFLTDYPGSPLVETARRKVANPPTTKPNETKLPRKP